jgi:hypothetical protein
MSTKRQRDSFEREQLLKSHGWDVDATIRENSGSETAKHLTIKALVGHILSERDLRWTMEAVHEDRGEVDVLCHGHPDGAPFAVEVEANVDREVVRDKLERYVHDTPLREMFVLPVDDAPNDIDDLRDWIESRIF